MFENEKENEREKGGRRKDRMKGRRRLIKVNEIRGVREREGVREGG